MMVMPHKDDDIICNVNDVNDTNKRRSDPGKNLQRVETQEQTPHACRQSQMDRVHSDANAELNVIMLLITVKQRQ